MTECRRILFCKVCRKDTPQRIEGDKETGYLAQCLDCGSIQSLSEKPETPETPKPNQNPFDHH